MTLERFFPFDPRAARALLTLGALGSIATLVLALFGLEGGGHLAEARAGLSGGLFLAFAYVRFRLRPRQGWGVLLTAEALVVAGPLSGEPARVPWSSVRTVARTGQKGKLLVLILDQDRKLLIPRHLFPSARAFDALAEAVEERGPAPQYDA